LRGKEGGGAIGTVLPLGRGIAFAASAALSRSAIILRWHCMSAGWPRSARPKPERLNAHPMPCIHRVLFCPTSRPLARRSTTTDSLSLDEVRSHVGRDNFGTDGCAATVGLGRGRPALMRSAVSRPSTSPQGQPFLSGVPGVGKEQHVGINQRRLAVMTGTASKCALCSGGGAVPRPAVLSCWASGTLGPP
jgi:hypothetical protein